MRFHPVPAFRLAALAFSVAILAGPLAAADTPRALPCRQPQLAAGGGIVYLACGTDTKVQIATSTDGGRTFALLTTIASGGALALGAHRGPRVAVAGDTVIVTAVVGALGGGKDGDLLAWRSTDRGLTWTGPSTVNDVPGSAREGLHAMAARGNAVATAWLDLRATGTRLYGSMSNDGGRSWQKNVLMYQSPSGSICECCHPSLTIAPDGTVLAMFRNAVDGHRDLYLTRGKGGAFGPAAKLGAGTWTLSACPMDGGALIVDDEGVVTTVWRREQTVYLAQPGGLEVAVGEGVNPAVAGTPAGPLVAWNAARGLTVAAPDRDALVLDPAGKFVALVSTRAGVVAAWETAGGTRTGVIEK